MKKIFKYVNGKYMEISNKVFVRSAITYPLYILCLIIPLILYFTDKVTMATARRIWLLSTLVVNILLRGDKNRTDSPYSYDSSDLTRGFEKKFRPAILDDPMDKRRTRQLREEDFALPVPPKGFVLKEDFRTASRQIASFVDDKGRVIEYRRTRKSDGVPELINISEEKILQVTIKGYPAQQYTDNNINHILYDTEFFSYHYYGNVDMNLLIEMAEYEAEYENEE